MFIDGLQYCNWSKKIFEDWRSANLTAVHVTISYHKQFRETISNFEKWNELLKYSQKTYVKESKVSKEKGAGYEKFILLICYVFLI